MLIDKYERRINYARLSVTDLCNLRCMYCMPEDGVKKERHEDILRVEEIIELAGILCEIGIDKIRITGGEPLVRRGIMDIIYGIKQNADLKTLALTTNAILLPKYINELKNAGVDGLNISLDSLKPERYKWITRGADLKLTLAAIDTALELGFKKIKLNIVLIKGFNDDEINDFMNITLGKPIDVRFIELMPIGACASWTKGRYIPTEQVLKSRIELMPLATDDISSPAVYYKLPDAKAKIGLISPMSCKFCKNCNRIRITADGKLKNCLHTDEELDIRAAIGQKDYELVRRLLKESISGKPPSHELESGMHIKRSMSKIGG